MKAMTPLMDDIVALKVTIERIVGHKSLDDLDSWNRIMLLGILRRLFNDREMWDQIEWLQNQWRIREKDAEYATPRFYNGQKAQIEKWLYGLIGVELS